MQQPPGLWAMASGRRLVGVVLAALLVPRPDRQTQVPCPVSSHRHLRLRLWVDDRPPWVQLSPSRQQRWQCSHLQLLLAPGTRWALKHLLYSTLAHRRWCSMHPVHLPIPNMPGTVNQLPNGGCNPSQGPRNHQQRKPTWPPMRPKPNPKVTDTARHPPQIASPADDAASSSLSLHPFASIRLVHQVPLSAPLPRSLR